MAESDANAKPSPGAILRAARELQGWSVDEVAAELNLLPEVVEALEHDDYSLTAGWTYAVGYLRNYARLAGVSVDRAIADRKELLPPKEDGPGTMTEALKNRKQPIPIHYRWVVTAAVLLFVFGGLYAAWINRSTDVERARIDVVEESRAPLGIAESATDGPVAEPVASQSLAVTLEAPTVLADSSSPSGQSSDMTSPQASEPSPEVGEPSTASATVPPSNNSESSLAGSGSEGSEPPEAVDSSAQEAAAVSTREASSVSAATIASAPAAAEKVAKKEEKRDETPKVNTTRSTPAGVSTQASSASQPSGSEDAAPQFATAFSNSVGSGSQSVTRPVSADTRELVIKVKENTHIVVWDRDEEVLLRRYVESGKVVSLAGRPPFTLAVSYPEGSSIIYGGREMPIPVPRTGLNAKIRVGR